MIRTLLRSFGRGPRRHLAAAAMALLVLGIASALAPTSRPRHPARRPPATASSPQTSGPERRGTSSLSRAEIARARKVAIRFLQGYLPFVYGRGSAGFVPAAAPALRRRLTRQAAVVTPAERRRHPRVLSLVVAGQAPGAALATALIADGGITSYALRITLKEGRSGWLVSAVGGG